QVISRLPLDSLLLETDSPDMPVFGFQGQPNRPERVVDIFNCLCELRKEPPNEIMQVIWRNSCD
ncbi:MAG TPA: deoxyribonuclease, partial [Pasteurellaceae bacterium]|nr:deoxyribonuclease [Pasteurellaceae bacterium]